MTGRTLKEREGSITYEEKGLVTKISGDKENWEGLLNSWRFLQALKDTDFVPTPIEIDHEHWQLKMEYIQNTPPSDSEKARRLTIQMLHTFQKRGITHGDLTFPNLLWRAGSSPVAIDWDQSNFTHLEARPQKRPKPDLVHVLPAVIEATLDPSRVLRRWLGLRDYIKYYFGWGTFLDLGTHMGDFCGLAAVEGMRAIGIDQELIRPCIDEATRLWGYMGAKFYRGDIVDYIPQINADIVMLFSTWAYIYNLNAEAGWNVLRACISGSKIFLFETQLYNDGPGPEFLKTKKDVINLLKGMGANEVEEAITIPVMGRDAERTVWIVT